MGDLLCEVLLASATADDPAGHRWGIRGRSV